MNVLTLLFIGFGIAIAIVGACVVALNWAREESDRTRQAGWIFFVAGLAMAVLTALATRVPPHSY
ncbi:MAG: hypothetical protein V4527_10850 [Pseudomonadota bacterium]